MVKDRTVIGPEIGPTVGNTVSITIIGEGDFIITIIIEIIGPTIELEVGLEMVMEGMIDMIVDQTIEGTILSRTKGKEIDVKVKIVIGPGKDLEITQGRLQEIGINTVIEAKAEEEIGDKGLGLIQGIETGKLGQEQIQDLDQVPMLALMETDLGAIDAANMIISQGNALMH